MKEVRQFNLDWGLDGKEFNVRSSYTDKEGCIYFGATEKLLKFDPQRMVERKHIQPVLYISALKLFNVPVESGSSILKNHIDNTDRIVLDNDQNFDFTPSWDFYDLQNDPHENHNAYNDPKYAPVIKQMKKDLLRLRKETGDTDGKYPEMQELLEKYYNK